MSKKLFLVVNVDWFFLSHRLELGLEALARGYDVTVFAIEEGGHGAEIESYGFKFVPLPATRSGTNLFKEVRLLYFLYKKYKNEKPDIVHHVSLKTVIHGSIAAKFVDIPVVVNALSGLGFLFINSKSNKLVYKLVMLLLSFGLMNNNIRFILQNEDDQKIISDFKKLSDEQIYLIKGSGVNLNKFGYSELPSGQIVRYLLPSRMLWDKGIGEFFEAAKIMKTRYNDRVHFVLSGRVDPGNKASITINQLQEWNDSTYVEWIGHQTDMVSVYEESNIVVLPSYREGLPKALIEACAVGRPIITTDVPGCREVVKNRSNGILVKVRCVDSLVKAMDELYNKPKLCEEYGRRGRNIAESEFSIENVIDKTFQVYNS